MKVEKKEAISQLTKIDSKFLTVFEHGSLAVEVYKPEQIDYQQPHTRDEVYVIIAGSGSFYNNGTTTTFSTGDFLFVKAGHEHRFENFTDDFVTWVIFYGPEGGEIE
ncbi:cupin domain-containing protein [Aurantibacter sp.]|uniref:cupin domain-containing protein n=1 Tax=Aurantibacter sp. TaxID=2807103 RepID=UPI0032675D33